MIRLKLANELGLDTVRWAPWGGDGFSYGSLLSGLRLFIKTDLGEYLDTTESAGVRLTSKTISVHKSTPV